MYSVGAPHTWPQALAALMWLIDTVKVRSKATLYTKNMQRTNKPNQVQFCVIKLFKASVVLLVCVSLSDQVEFE